MKKRIAILQSNYVPWKGTFDLIGLVDEFVLYDEVQFTKNDWRNRNRIKTQGGVQWLTIPVRAEGRFGQRILDVEIADPRWGARHWKTISQSYARAPHFARYREGLESLYLDQTERSLSQVNQAFLAHLCGELGIETPIRWSHEVAPRSQAEVDRNERLIEICRALGAERYLSGRAGESYLDQERFAAAGIEVEWMDYADYPEYPQLHPPFEHAVSAIDLLLQMGPEAAGCMKFPTRSARP